MTSASGRPVPAPLLAGYAAAALASWVAAGVAFLVAAPELAAGKLGDHTLVLAVHLVTVGFLPLAISGAALHILPTLLRADASPRRAAAALPLLCTGPALAAGIAFEFEALLWATAVLVAAGFAIVAWELAALALRAPADRLLLASRTGVLLTALHVAAALVFGGGIAVRESDPLWGMPHERAIGIHVHLSAIGWVTLLLVTVARTLAPMLALAPSAPRRRLPADELVLTAGLWLLLPGLALGLRPLMIAGSLVVLVPVARLAALAVRVERERHLATLEGPLLHLLVGVFFLVQAAVLGLGMLLGLELTRQRVVAYGVALLVGWAAGTTLGHLGKLLSLSLWGGWPPGPRPSQASLYPRRLWVAEAAVFGAGLTLVVDGTLAGSGRAVEVGAALVLCSALAAAAAALASARAGRPALAGRPRATSAGPL